MTESDPLDELVALARQVSATAHDHVATIVALYRQIHPQGDPVLTLLRARALARLSTADLRAELARRERADA